MRLLHINVEFFFRYTYAGANPTTTTKKTPYMCMRRNTSRYFKKKYIKNYAHT